MTLSERHMYNEAKGLWVSSGEHMLCLHLKDVFILCFIRLYTSE